MKTTTIMKKITKTKLSIVICFMVTLSGFSQYTLIPDAGFENALSAYDDIPGDGQVPTANIVGVTTLNIVNPSPAAYPAVNTFLNNLTGIQDFTALQELTCNDSNLTTLNLSSNLNLTKLTCRRSVNLTTLTLTQNAELTWLWVAGNGLTALDLSGNPKLERLWCHFNSLTALNVSANPLLYNIVCGNNNISTLDLSANTVLNELYCVNNSLTSLNVSANTALTKLEVNGNGLTSLDVSANTVLNELNCVNNSLTSLDVHLNTALTILKVDGNDPLTSLNVKNGNNTNFTHYSSTVTPNLTCIIVDDATYSTTNWTNKDSASTFVNDDAACNALNVQQNTFGAAFKVYPNPSNGVSTINLGDNYEKVTMQITNILGKVVSKQTYNNINAVTLNTKGYASGLYIIQVQSELKTATIKLIVD